MRLITVVLTVLLLSLTIIPANASSGEQVRLAVQEYDKKYGEGAYRKDEQKRIGQLIIDGKLPRGFKNSWLDYCYAKTSPSSIPGKPSKWLSRKSLDSWIIKEQKNFDYHAKRARNARELRRISTLSTKRKWSYETEGTGTVKGIPRMSDAQAARWKLKKRQTHQAQIEKIVEQKTKELNAGKKEAAAIASLKKLAKSGNANAALNLGRYFLDKKKNTEEALSWLYLAAKNGSSAASFFVGRIYLDGDGTSKDLGKALKWFSASQIPESQFLAGKMRVKGIGAEANTSQAWQFLKKAAQAGNSLASADLGELRFLGLGVSKNNHEAKKWLKSASLAENPKALFYLQQMYATGDGVEIDMRLADQYKVRFLQAVARFKAGNDAASKLALDDPAGFPDKLKMMKKPVRKVAAIKKTAQKKIQNLSKSKPKKEEPKKPLELVDILNSVGALVNQHYPRAKATKTDKGLHVEFKTKKMKQTNGKTVMAPKLDGIFFDITEKPGKYNGFRTLPLQTNDTFYTTIMMAPYSKTKDAHLLTTLLFPPNAPVEFVTSFKKAINSY